GASGGSLKEDTMDSRQILGNDVVAGRCMLDRKLHRVDVGQDFSGTCSDAPPRVLCDLCAREGAGIDLHAFDLRRGDGLCPQQQPRERDKGLIVLVVESGGCSLCLRDDRTHVPRQRDRKICQGGWDVDLVLTGAPVFWGCVPPDPSHETSAHYRILYRVFV